MRNNRLSHVFIFLFLIVLGLRDGATMSVEAQNPTKKKAAKTKPIASEVKETASDPGDRVVVNAPNDDIIHNEKTVYLLRVLPNFIAYVELPDVPDGIFVGNTARYYVETYVNAQAGGNGQVVGNGMKVDPRLASKFILVKPLKVEQIDNQPIESSLTIKLANGKLLLMTVRNAENEGQNVHYCRFRDLEQEKREQEERENARRREAEEAERTRLAALALERASVRVRRLISQGTEPLGPILKVKDGEISVRAERDQEFLLVCAEVRARGWKTLTLTTPTWRIDAEDLPPTAEIQALPNSVKRAAVRGGWIFRVPAWSQQSQDRRVEQLTLGIGVQGNVAQVVSSLGMLNSSTALYKSETKALPGYGDEETKNSVRRTEPEPPADGTPARPQAITSAQSEGLSVLNQVLGVEPPARPTTSQPRPDDPVRTQPVSSGVRLADAQSRLDELTLTTNVRTPGVTLSQAKDVIVALRAERFGAYLLAVLAVERARGTRDLEIGGPTWNLAGIPVQPLLVFRPLPSTLKTQPLAAGYLFQVSDESATGLSATIKIDRQSRVLRQFQDGSTSASPIRAPKTVLSDSVEWNLMEVVDSGNQTRIVFEARNKGSRPIEEIEAFSIERSRQSDGVEITRSFPIAQSAPSKNRLNAGETARLTFVSNRPATQLPFEIRWQRDGFQQGLKVDLTK